MSYSELIQALKGGSGSGNFNHAGIPGKRGGSAPGSGGGNKFGIRSKPVTYASGQQGRAITGKTSAQLNLMSRSEFIRSYGIVTGKQIGRASCRERVLRLV